MKLLFATSGDRSQIVMLWKHEMLGEDWVEIESPIASYQDVSLVDALREVGSLVCGGLALTGELLTLRHSVPLANLDENEFEKPLQAVMTCADQIERRLTGRDVYSAGDPTPRTRACLVDGG